MATIYTDSVHNTSDNLYYRCKCTYTKTLYSTYVSLKLEVELQAKGTYKKDSYVSVMGGGDAGASMYTDEYPVASATAEPTRSYTDWTTVKSGTGTVKINRQKTSTERTVVAGVSDWLEFGAVKDYDKHATGTVTINALPSYTVSFSANGGTGAPASQTKYHGINLTLTSKKPTRTGYTFLGWSSSSTATSAYYPAGGTYVKNESDTLYAVWKKNTYAVTYNANGGTGAPAGQTKTYGTALTLSSVRPSRAGFVFSKWNTAANGSGTSYNPGASYTGNAALTLYAQWLSLPAKPTVSSMSAIRWDETEDEQSDTGTSAKITVDWSVDTSSGYYGGTNTGTVEVKLTSAKDGSTKMARVISGASGTGGTAVFVASNIGVDARYTVETTIRDLNGSTVKSVILTAAFFVMDFHAGGKGIGVGKAAPENGFAVGYEMFIDNIVHALGFGVDLDCIITDTGSALTVSGTGLGADLARAIIAAFDYATARDVLMEELR